MSGEVSRVDLIRSNNHYCVSYKLNGKEFYESLFNNRKHNIDRCIELVEAEADEVKRWTISGLGEKFDEQLCFEKDGEVVFENC